jgi:hypothetical protein
MKAVLMARSNYLKQQAKVAQLRIEKDLIVHGCSDSASIQARLEQFDEQAVKDISEKEDIIFDAMGIPEECETERVLERLMIEAFFNDLISSSPTKLDAIAPLYEKRSDWRMRSKIISMILAM